jgi:trimethylamine--corrinoid protein Co-methyltransferase
MGDSMRPKLRFLEDNLIEKILSESRQLLCELGVQIHNREVLQLLGDNGARVDLEKEWVFFTEDMIDKGLKDVPKGFKLFDVSGNQTHDFSGDNSHFTPGSAAINIMDSVTGKMRKPVTKDYIEYVRLVSGLKNIGSQSTAFVPSDVNEMISDSYRLYLSLKYGFKPVVTGTFSIDSFAVMKDMQLAVRGTEAELKAKPLTIFSCCPTSPLKWSDHTSQTLLDCAKYSIPVELISMPLLGFMAPVTVVGSLVLHTAETLSGIVISQLANPGTPVLYGGAPAAFDLRYETTPMGAIETQMIDCAYSEIGKYLGIPTQAYIGMSDAKQLDAQAGLETSMGATLAVLSGINNISGAGILNFINSQSLEKLVVDNEICAMTFRMAKGVEPKDDFPAIPIFQELIKDHHLLISKHTRKHLRTEHHFPGVTIDRANLDRWYEEGSTTMWERAQGEVKRILADAPASPLDSSILSDLTKLMTKEAANHGMDKLPENA